MSSARAGECPICKKPAGARPQNPFGPFCSQRCRTIDLGSWLAGDYAIPGEPLTPAEVARGEELGDEPTDD